MASTTRVSVEEQARIRGKVCECGGSKTPYANRCATCLKRKPRLCACGQQMSHTSKKCARCHRSSLRPARYCRCGKKLHPEAKWDKCRQCVVGTRIPTARVIPILESLAAERSTGMTEAGEEYGGIVAVARETGLSYRKLRAVLKCEAANQSFDFVDKLLMGTQNWMLWYETPENGGLQDYYCDNPGPPATKPPPRPRQEKKVRETRFCDGCGNPIDRRAKRWCHPCYLKRKLTDDEKRWKRECGKFFIKHP